MEQYASPLMNTSRSYNTVNPSFFRTLPRMPSMMPPLLPLPINVLDRSSSMPPPGKNSAIAAAAGVKNKDNRRPKRSAKRDKKRIEVQKPVVAPPPPLKDVDEEEEVFFFMAPQKPKKDDVAVVFEEEEEEMSDQSYVGSLYSISPPPSCLPLPKFFLEKPCMPPAAKYFTVEARGHTVSTTADHRRLLGI